MPEETITISVKTMNNVLGYLGTRPYQEVFQLIAAVQQEAVANAQDKPAE